MTYDPQLQDDIQHDYDVDPADVPRVEFVEKPTFDSKGRRTVKIQWARRLFHMSSCSIPLTVYFLGLSRTQALLWFLPVLLLYVVPEIVRLTYKPFNRLYCRVLGFLMRPHEVRALSPAVEMAIAVYLGVAFFGVEIMTASFLCLSFGDPIAAIVGLKFGRIRVLGKTLEGSLACLGVSTFMCSLFFPGNWPVAILGGIGATLGELIPIRGVNDNIRIPFFASLAISLGLALGGLSL